MSRFLKIIVNLVVIAAIAVAAALLVPPFMGIDTVMNDNTETDTNLPVGSVAYGQSKDAADLKTGDRIIYSEGSSDYIYEITDMDASAGVYKVKDPYNSNSDAQNITIQKSVPKVALVVPFIGYGAIALQSTEGLIVVGLGIVFLIILFILSEIWRKDRDEDEAEEEEEESGEDVRDEEDEEEDEDEEILSRRERRRLKKEEKRRRKMEKKGIREEDEEEEEEEIPEPEGLEEADTRNGEEPEQALDKAVEEAAPSVAAGISGVSEPEQVPDATIVMPDISSLEQENISEEIQEGEEEISREEEEILPSEENGASAAEAEEGSEVQEEEAAEEPVVPEEAIVPEEPAVTEEPIVMEEPVVPEEPTVSEEPAVQEPQETAEEAFNPEAVLHAPTVEELLAKAQADGDAPEVKEDKENEVTLLDYSDIL